MNKTIFTIVIAAVVVLAGYFLLRGAGQPRPLVTQTPNQKTVPQPLISESPTPEPTLQKIVTYTDAGYSPSTLTVKRGEIVTFKNQSLRSMWPASAVHPIHMAYSGTSLSAHCPDTAGNAFDACKGFLPSDSWSFKFNKTGAWKYHDHLNPGSIGIIVVE